jgi:hypothetical protein
MCQERWFAQDPTRSFCRNAIMYDVDGRLHSSLFHVRMENNFLYNV